MRRTAYLLLFLAALALPACHSTIDALDTDIDLEPFRILARTDTGCSELANRLFLIDGVQVFHHREGQCPDGAYTLTLYGSTPEDIRCQAYDSIAGPQEHCLRAFAPLFATIRTHLDAPDLGLGPRHRVERISF